MERRQFSLFYALLLLGTFSMFLVSVGYLIRERSRRPPNVIDGNGRVLLPEEITVRPQLKADKNAEALFDPGGPPELKKDWREPRPWLGR